MKHLLLLLALSLSAHAAPKSPIYQSGNTVKVLPLGGLLLNGGQSLSVPSATITTGDLFVNSGNVDIGLGGLTVGGGITASSYNGGNLSGDNSGDLTLSVFGATPNASGASLLGQVLTLQPANGSNPGLVSATTQSFGGNKTFTGSVTLSAGSLSVSSGNIDVGLGGVTVGGGVTASSFNGGNLSGDNSGDLTLTNIGIFGDAFGATLSGQALTLQPATSTTPGILTAIGSQSIGGNKVFTGSVTSSAMTVTTGDLLVNNGNIDVGLGGITVGGGVTASTFNGGILSGDNTGDILLNAVALKSRNAANTANVDLISANTSDQTKLHGNVVRIADMFFEKNGGINNDIYPASEDTNDANPAGTLTIQAQYKSTGTGQGGTLQYLGGDSAGGPGGPVRIKGGLGTERGDVVINDFTFGNYPGVPAPDVYPTIIIPPGVPAGSTTGYSFNVVVGAVTGVGEKGGGISLEAGPSTNGEGGDAYINAANGLQGGLVNIQSGQSTQAGNNGGPINLIPGPGGAGAARGEIVAYSHIRFNDNAHGIKFKTGANPKKGSATLVGGTVTVSNTSVRTSSMVIPVCHGASAGHGALRIENIVDETSFDINSSNALDTCTVKYLIIDEAA